MLTDAEYTPAEYTPPLRPGLIEQTERYRRLNKLDTYYKGTQYKGRPDFWTGGNDRVPLRERAPIVVYPLPRAVVNQATRFTFGEGRFPALSVPEVSADDAIAPGLELSTDQAAVVHAGVSAIVEQAELRSVMRRLLRRGLSSCTSVAVIALRKGKFQVDSYHPKNCLPTFVSGSTTELEALTVCYRFDKLVPDPVTGHPVYRPHFYRRDFTRDESIVFEDVEIPNGIVPAEGIRWKVDEKATVQHRLGFCPAVWTPNLREEDGDPDGCSLYEGLEDEFDALNFALSQRHRGINYWGVPQPWERLSEDGQGPAASARTARPAKTDGSGYSKAEASTDKARATSPDQIWTYRDEKAEVGLLETTGKAFEAATLHVLDIRSRILEAIDVVLLDPTTVAGSGDISAKALSYLYAPLLGLVDELRECWWTHGLLPLLSMCLRMIAVLDGKGVLLPSVRKLLPILARCMVDDGSGAKQWIAPKLTPIWGDYFSPSNGEVQVGVQTAAAAKEAKLISNETAAEYVAPYFGVTDVDDELEDIDEDAAAALKAAQEAIPDAAGKVVGQAGKTTPEDEQRSDGGEPNAPQETITPA